MKKKTVFNSPEIDKQHFRRHLVYIVCFLSIFALLIVLRLGYLQLAHHKRYKTLSQKNILSVMPFAPARGIITDRNGVIVAENKPTFALAVIPERSRNINASIKQLSKIIPIDADSIRLFNIHRRQSRPYQHVTLLSKIDAKTLARFAVNQYLFPGFVIDTNLQRTYPLGKDLAPVVGYVGRITAADLENVDPENYLASTTIGKTGIENYYEKTLHGTIGTNTNEINASGHTIRSVSRIQAVSGKNIQLTIDSRLQHIAETALGKETGAVVAIDPRSGEILAFASSPSFDPNLLTAGIDQKTYNKIFHHGANPMFNRALDGLFSIGSTVKPFIALAALQEKVITPQTKIFDPGWFQLPNTKHIYHDWRLDGHGWVNVSKAIRVSCDTFFYNLATKLGISTVDKYLADFGFGKATGIDMPHEKTGVVPSPYWKKTHTGMNWYTGNTILTLIGQGYMLATPLQLANATMLLANRGFAYTPHMVRSISDSDNHSSLTQLIPEPMVSLPKNEWQLVDNAMQQVIRAPDGTGEHFGRNPPYTVAAKTGTAQLYAHNRDEEHSETDIPKKVRNNHLFIAFAPIKNPQIAIAVIVEHAAKAAAVARQVLDAQWQFSNHFTNPISPPRLNNNNFNQGD